MAKKKPLPSELNRSIYEQLFQPQLSKADLRKIQILEAAIDTYAQLPLDYVSYEDIARAAKISRPLVLHHFPEKRDLFATMVKFVRAKMQETAVEELSGARPDALARFKAYINSTFKWLSTQPDHMRVWIFHFYVCASDPEFREGHKELTEIGMKRISALLEQGEREGTLSAKNADAKAKSIQAMITGSLIEAISENDPRAWDSIRKRCLEQTLMIAGA